LFADCREAIDLRRTDGEGGRKTGSLLSGRFLAVGGRRNSFPLFCAALRAASVRIRVYLFSILCFALLHLFVRDSKQVVH
jgi:hypothetical protein